MFCHTLLSGYIISCYWIHVKISPKFSKIYSASLWQFNGYTYCPSVSEVILKDMGKFANIKMPHSTNSVCNSWDVLQKIMIPDNKVNGANMGPIWGRQDPGGPHVGPMNFAMWDSMPGGEALLVIITYKKFFTWSGLQWQLQTPW